MSPNKLKISPGLIHQKLAPPSGFAKTINVRAYQPLPSQVNKINDAKMSYQKAKETFETNIKNIQNIQNIRAKAHGGTVKSPGLMVGPNDLSGHSVFSNGNVSECTQEFGESHNFMSNQINSLPSSSQKFRQPMRKMAH